MMKDVVAVVAVFGVVAVAVFATVTGREQSVRRPSPTEMSADRGDEREDATEKKPYGEIPVPDSLYGHPEKFAPRPSKSITKEEVERLKLSLKEARYWRKLSGKVVQCLLCPRHCVIKDGERGACRIRANYGGKLYALTYGKPVALNNDPIEKKPLFHFLPGTKSFSIATIGCNFGCVFCQNWHISQEYPECGNHLACIGWVSELLPGKKDFTVLTPKEVVRLAEICGAKSIAFTYTEPSVFYEYIFDIAKEAHERGIKTVWVTCGYMEEEPLREFCKFLDAANVDLKGFSEEFYERYCGATLEPVLKTLKILKEERVWFEITNLIIPGANDSDEMIRKMCEWIKENLGPDVPVHFSRFHPDYRLKDRPPTPFATLERAAGIAKEVGLRYIYIGNVWEPGVEDTVCPNCGKRIIKRNLMRVTENRIRDGKCAFCGASIPGVWTTEDKSEEK